ncbi:DUF3618 domain-containing protein [Nonomuraea africana]|uniref:DUF3618 domain-containing protein n=1 Tax=Nonomuraea africana TaxID=46171 RepID=UPI0033C31CB0
MGTRPEEIRDEIARTRAELATDVDRFTDKTSPSRIVQRRTDRMRRAARTMRERIMGTPTQAVGRVQQRAGDVGDRARQGTAQATETLTHGAQQAADTVRQGAQQATEAVKAAPQQAMRSTEGNPLAAGLIAFGAGLLAAALIPKTETEQRAAEQLREQAGEAFQPFSQAVQESAQHLGEEAKDAAQQAVQQVRETATDAATTTGEQARDQAQQVTGQNRPTGPS